VATLSGLGQTGEAFSRLFGTTTAFDPATLVRLYPGGCPDYLARFADALEDTIAAGFVLGEDRDEILAVAAASYPTRD
jgi:Alpha/beta hydrolase domain